MPMTSEGAVSVRADIDAQWDEFVQRQRGWTHYHLLGWRTVVQQVFGHECLYLSANDGQGRLTGILPLVRVKSRLFGHYLVSMPFLNYGGPLGSPEAVRALVKHAVELGRRDGVTLVEFRSAIELDVDLPLSHRKVTVLLDLPAGDADDLWRDLKAKVRSQIRRPMKDGVEVRFGSQEADAFYHVYSHNMRDLGTPGQSRALFRAISETFGEDVWFGCAYLEGCPIAAGCGFRWGDEFEMTWASSLRAHNRLAPNMLLYWRFIERSVGEGLRRFNFGRCSPGGGTHRFKRQWGGAYDVPLWWYFDARGARTRTPSPDDAAYAWAPRVWRHLPLTLTRMLGPRIVRNIP